METTTKLQRSKDRQFVRATCSCGWKGQPRKATNLARYDADQHTARHAARRTKEQIAADRAALLASLSPDWQTVPWDAKASDVDYLRRTGQIESQVRSDLASRQWLQPGRLKRNTLLIRPNAKKGQ